MKEWDSFLWFLDQKLCKGNVDKWLRSIRIIKFDARNLYLDFKNIFQINWFDEHVSPFLPKHFINKNGIEIKVHFFLNGKNLVESEDISYKKEEAIFCSDFLQEHARLDSFLLGDEEVNISYKILLNIVDSNLDIINYNPIFIYGPSGSGKSHLLMGTARSMIDSGKRCIYVNCATFIDHVIKAFRSTNLQGFRKIYRNADILIVDDVDLLSGKLSTQEEFFHTFNYLHTTNKQIILGSSHSPSDLVGISNRLVSRFEWGITIPINMPSENSVRKILDIKLEKLSLKSGDDLKNFLIDNFKNLHSLMVAVEYLALYAPKSNFYIDVDIAKFHLKELIEKEQLNRLTPEKVIESVSKIFDLRYEDVIGKNQSKEYVVPRQISIYICREYLNISLLKLGRAFNRNHSTILSSLKRVKKAIENGESYIIDPMFKIKEILHL